MSEHNYPETRWVQRICRECGHPSYDTPDSRRRCRTCGGETRARDEVKRVRPESDLAAEEKRLRKNAQNRAQYKAKREDGR